MNDLLIIHLDLYDVYFDLDKSRLREKMLSESHANLSKIVKIHLANIILLKGVIYKVNLNNISLYNEDINAYCHHTKILLKQSKKYFLVNIEEQLRFCCFFY